METKVKSVANSFQELFHSRHYVGKAPFPILHKKACGTLMKTEGDSICDVHMIYEFLPAVP